MSTDFTLEAERLSYHRYRFYLYPALWATYTGPGDLDWNCVAFTNAGVAQVPDVPGVYAFCIKPNLGGNLCGAYLLYVGMTDRGLRTRSQEYLRKVGTEKERPKIIRMLRIFADTNHLFFCFAEAANHDAKEVEERLLEVTLPPACSQLPARVQPAVAAFE